jgi:hypothetical protein
MGRVADGDSTLPGALTTCEASGGLRWIARSGKLRPMALPEGWLSVQAALGLPLLDTSWMSDPWPPEKFTKWMGCHW